MHQSLPDLTMANKITVAELRILKNLSAAKARKTGVRSVAEAVSNGATAALVERKGARVGSGKAKNDYKAKFLSDLAMLHVPAPILEFVFASPRRWRFDFCWPDQMIAVEYQGGTYMRGKSGHSNVAGLERDYEKFTEASLRGWRVILINAKTVINGQAVEWVLRGMSRD